jgi:hypothetical protein
MHLIESPQGSDNPLVNLGAFTVVFDHLKVFVLTGLFGSSKHVEASHQDTSTLQDNLSENQGKMMDSVALHF